MEIREIRSPLYNLLTFPVVGAATLRDPRRIAKFAAERKKETRKKSYFYTNAYKLASFSRFKMSQSAYTYLLTRVRAHVCVYECERNE